jgi:hypothetical protein
MLCFIHKWKISHALDTGKPLSRSTGRHLFACETCREFYRTGGEVGRRLSMDAASLLQEPRPGLDARTRQTTGEAAKAKSPLPSPSRRPQLRPVWAAALLLAAVGVSLIWTFRTRPAPMPRLDPLLSLAGPRSYLESALRKAESPYDKELEGLKKTLRSTADYLAARFETGLGDSN